MFNKLKTALEQKAGTKLDTVKACRKMEQILYERGYFVSYTTLSRIFSIAKISARPRRETLNLLSSYLGFGSYEQFLAAEISNNEMDERFLRRSLDIKSKLLIENYYDAIDGTDNPGPDGFLKQDIYLRQYIGSAIFNHNNADERLFSYLLDKDLKSQRIEDHFIYEDDPKGHFQWSLENLTVNLPKNEDRHQLEKLFICRKKLLKGQKLTGIPAIEADAHFELFSRFLELRILKAKRQKSIIAILDELLSLVHNKEEFVKLTFAARASRGLLYLKNLNFLRKAAHWRNFCLEVFESGPENPGDKAFVFALLKIAYKEQLPLSFFSKASNISLEAMMMLALAFDEQEAVENYRKYLGVLR